jgi:uncharacterized protein YodC (DUF2158 family)
MADELMAGDTVQLNSGGPKMMIDGIGPRGLEGKDGAWCSWFESKKRKAAWFELESLTKI